MVSLYKFNSPMIMTPNLPIGLFLLRTPNLPIGLLLIRTSNLPISLLLLRTITMKMLLHHIYFLRPKLYNRSHGLPLVTTVPVVFSFYDYGVPPDVMLLEVVVSPPLHSGMVKPFYLFL
jgi:hypothetical protein